MAAHHIPGILLPLVILLELGAGTALMVGWKLPCQDLSSSFFAFFGRGGPSTGGSDFM